MLTSLNNADRERRKLDHNEQCGTACLQGEFASTRRRVPEAVGFGDLQPHVNLGTCPADHSTGDQSRGGRGGYVGTPAIPLAGVLGTIRISPGRCQPPLQIWRSNIDPTGSATRMSAPRQTCRRGALIRDRNEAHNSRPTNWSRPVGWAEIEACFNNPNYPRFLPETLQLV